MNPGDLVEIYDEDGQGVSIGNDRGAADRDFPVGTLCVYLGVNQEWTRRRSAVDILIDGARGWVWEDEIRRADDKFPQRLPPTRATPS